MRRSAAAASSRKGTPAPGAMPPARVGTLRWTIQAPTVRTTRPGSTTGVAQVRFCAPWRCIPLVAWRIEAHCACRTLRHARMGRRARSCLAKGAGAECMLASEGSSAGEGEGARGPIKAGAKERGCTGTSRRPKRLHLRHAPSQRKPPPPPHPPSLESTRGQRVGNESARVAKGKTTSRALLNQRLLPKGPTPQSGGCFVSTLKSRPTPSRRGGSDAPPTHSPTRWPPGSPTRGWGGGVPLQRVRGHRQWAVPPGGMAWGLDSQYHRANRCASP